MARPSSNAAPSDADQTHRAARLADALDRARSGEREALDDIVRELNPLLWQVVRAQGLDAEPAADVVQTTWLEFLRCLDTIHSPQALTGWLIVAARREAWRVRKRARDPVRAVPDTEAVEATVSTRADVAELVFAEESHRALWQAMGRLSQRCRELLWIVAMVDRPDYDLVSEALGMPRGSIGPTRGRCLAKMRELLLADPKWSR